MKLALSDRHVSTGCGGKGLESGEGQLQGARGSSSQDIRLEGIMRVS